jgi:hypothetical protein
MGREKDEGRKSAEGARGCIHLECLPNGLALSRLADYANVGSVYNKRHRRL